MGLKIATALLLAATVTVSGTTVLTAGPEHRFGTAGLEPWSGFATGLQVATDGEEMVLFWRRYVDQRPVILAVRLDREGKTLTPVPLQIAAPETRNAFFATWLSGQYVVFTSDRDTGLHATRLTRDLQPLGMRKLSNDYGAVFGQRVGDEVAIAVGNHILRFRADLTPAAAPLILPDGGGSSKVAAGDGGRYAILDDRTPTGTLRLYDGTSYTRMSRVAGAQPRGIWWTGSEFLLRTALEVQRFDRDLQPIGAPATLPPHITDLEITPLGDGTVWLQWNDGPYWNRGFVGVRWQPGTPISTTPVRLDESIRGALPILTSDDRLLLVDPKLRIAPVPPRDSGTSLTWAPVAFIASSEVFAGAGASSQVLAAARRRGSDNAITVSVMRHDGTILRELVMQGPAAAFTTAGGDLVALTGSELLNLTAGSPPRTVNAYTPLAFVWTGTEFMIGGGLRVLRMTPEGELEPLCLQQPDLDTFPPSIARYAAAPDGEVLLTWHQQMVFFRGGCAVGGAIKDPLLAFPHRLAWQDGRFAMVFADGDRRLRLAFLHGRASFVAMPGEIARDASVLQFAPAHGGGWAVAYTRASKLYVALLDANGGVIVSGLVAEGVASSSEAGLVPLSDGRLAVFYTRATPESPFFGVSRTYMRIVEVERGNGRRRAVR